VFSTALDFALVTSVVSKWWPFNFIFGRRNIEEWSGWEMTVMLFLVKNSLVRCHDVTASSFCRQSLVQSYHTFSHSRHKM
jgi:hypothetical protein